MAGFIVGLILVAFVVMVLAIIFHYITCPGLNCQKFCINLTGKCRTPKKNDKHFQVRDQHYENYLIYESFVMRLQSLEVVKVVYPFSNQSES